MPMSMKHTTIMGMESHIPAMISQQSTWKAIAALIPARRYMESFPAVRLS